MHVLLTDLQLYLLVSEHTTDLFFYIYFKGRNNLNLMYRSLSVGFQYMFRLGTHLLEYGCTYLGEEVCCLSMVRWRRLCVVQCVQ